MRKLSSLTGWMLQARQPRILLLACVSSLLVAGPGMAQVRDFPLLDAMPRVAASSMQNGVLNGYLIGGGPAPHSRPEYHYLYQGPTEFIEVTGENRSRPVSAHFRLEQFLCKQEASYPKYLALRPTLLELLERLVGHLNGQGFDVATLGVISGYRTPWYNRKIGNTPNSRHLYGDAMDFYIDRDGDGRMDDLDGDGRLTNGDIDFLYELVDAFRRLPGNADLIGGVGRYYPNGRHGGFIHVDTRGYRARW